MASEKQLEVVKQTRTSLRTQATKAVKKFDELFATISLENREDAIVLSQKLADLRKSLSENDVIIQENLPSAELEADIDRSFQYADFLLSAIEKLKSRLSDFKELQASSGVVSSPSPLSPAANFENSKSHKLQKLKLMEFDGDPIHWAEFWDDFSSTVDSHNDIPVIDKFKHLKNALKGDALRVVSGYMLTIANYQQVKDDLNERYGDPEIAIFAHLEALLAIPPASHSLEQLSKVRDQCEMHIRSLVALGLSEETFGLVFTPILLSKLPLYVKMELHRKNGSNKWTLGALRQLLKEEIKARDKSERGFGTQQDGGKKDGRKGGPAQGGKTPQSTAMLNGGKDNGSKAKKNPKCTYCDGTHYSAQCETYKTADSRVKLLTEKSRCFICLSDRHRKPACPRKNQKCYFCKKEGHHSSLCFLQFGKPNEHGTSKREESKTTSCMSFSSLNPTAPEFQPHNVTTMASTDSKKKKRVSFADQQSRRGTPIMETLLADVSGSKQKQEARFVFDSASTRSFATRDLMQRTGARYLGAEYTSMGRFRDEKRVTCKYEVYELDVKLKDGSTMPLRLSAVDAVSPPVNLYPMRSMEGFEVVQKLELAEQLVVEEREVHLDILVGLDYYYDLVTDEKIRFPNGLVVLSTKLGYMATGFLDGEHASRNDTSMFTSAEPVNPELHDWEKYWALEEIGITDDPGMSDDDIACAHFNRTVKFEHSRYFVKWPYKENIPELPDNYLLAHGRLKSLVNKRLKPNPDIMKEYDQIIQKQVKKNVIEKAPEVATGRTHYVPHHCVLTPWKATTKVRIVYDASAKASKTALSLNECLHRGPVMMADLCGLVLRFRLPKIAIISDIEKAYHQIWLQEEDRDVTRFLWLKDVSKPVTADNLQIFRFVGVPFGFVSSPFLLAGCISMHIEAVKQEVGINMADDVYIDNIAGGGDSVQQAVEYYAKAKKVFDGASMNLREWFSNSKEFMDKVADCDRGDGATATVLGLKWDTDGDAFFCPPGRKVTSNAKTKRSILSSLASTYDPCGWFSPVTIKSKMLMQEIWKGKYGWDDPLPDEVVKNWSEVQQNVAEISNFSISRVLDPDIRNPEVDKQLHCFVDASAKAYAAAVFIRVSSRVTVGCHLLFAKARVAPIKQVSIPRLELIAAQIGIRLLKFVEKELKIGISTKFLWSDSKVVLAWIKRERLSTPFVENRVREIRSYEGVSFRYVRTQENPADLPTRGVPYATLSVSAIWWHGPEWLIMPPNEWPVTETEKTEESTSDTEMQPAVSLLTAVNPNDDVFDLKRYSSLMKLYRVTAYVFRVLRRVKVAVPCDSPITANEVNDAQIFWDKRIQSRYFDQFLSKRVVPRNSPYAQLGLLVDSDGFVRCRGRMERSSLTVHVKYPILLPRDDSYTRLVIEQAHREVLHYGVQQTLAQFRQKYWIVRGRSTVRSIISHCLLCRRHKGGPFKIPSAPPLPEFRVTMRRPFSAVGLDYLGPLLVRSPQGTSKIWICLFTCTVIRAVHLEVVSSLSTQDFLLCFRRFAALYGKPQLVISDNATQFKAAKSIMDKLWQDILENPEIQEYSTSEGIAWKFIPESAAWMGGFYERLVGTVKNGLKFSLQRRLVSLVEAQTVVLEISAVINNRPLTEDSDDPSLSVLTPAHFLRGNSDLFPNAVQTENFEVEEVLQNELVRNWKLIQALVNMFWTRWHKEYLAKLREHHREPRQRNVSSLPLQVGAVVLVGENAPRSVWKIARVKSLHLSQDGECRSVELLMPNRKVLVRPVKLLYPLECSSKDSLPDAKRAASNVQSRPPTTRVAALRARARINENLAEEAGSQD